MLVLLATVMFGPEKIPEFSRKAARVVFFLRGVANNAQQQLRDELGPEYADLELKDLHPKALVQKHVLDAIQGDLDDIRADLDDVKADVEGVTRDANQFHEEMRHQIESDEALLVGVSVPWDVEAT